MTTEIVYSIKKFSLKVQLPVTTLRYYEKEGLLPNVKRDKNGYRQYTEQNVEWVDFLKKMQKIAIPLTELKRYSQLLSQGKETHNQRLELLYHHQKQVENELQELLIVQRYLANKIAAYEAGLIQ